MQQATLASDPRVPAASVPRRSFRIPAGAAALFVLGGLLAPLLPHSIVDPASPVAMPAHASSTQTPAVATRTDPSVPDASEVFRGREMPVSEPAPTF